MKFNWTRGILTAVAVAGAAAIGLAQNVLGRLDSDIRQANGQPVAAAAPAARVYLGAVALDENGLGVRISSVREGGPAQSAGLQPQDRVVGAGGKRIQLLRELTAVLKRMNPGDRLVLDVMRGGRQMHVEVVLAAPPAVSYPAARQTLPPPTGAGGGPREPIPPPPADLNVPALAEGPALTVPQSPPPNGMQAQIDELHHRVEVLERRVQELERALADKQKR